MKFILSLDQGTTSCRALLINHEGETVGIAQKEFRQIYPKPGWVEHDANEIWSIQAAVTVEVLEKNHIALEQIAAIGITNQRETTVIWNRLTSEPIAPAIVWQDRRTSPLCSELKKKNYSPLFHKKTGLLLDPYFSGTKIAWLLDTIPGARKQAEMGELAFGTIDSWLVWKLTDGKVHITDATNASRTLLYNIHTGEWDEELLRILNVPRLILPEVRGSSEIYGHTSTQLFTIPIPIAGIAGDQQAALFGHACLTEGMGKVTYGTGCFILVNTGSKPVLAKGDLLTTIAYKIGNEVTYAIEGSVFIGGAAVQWLRDNLDIIENASDIEELASSVPDSEGVVFVPCFTGLGSPYWDPHARGTIFGLTRGTTKAHLALATLEAIAFQVADIIDLMRDGGRFLIKELRVDGGAVRDNLLMQLSSNLLNIPLIRPKSTEITALGAAFLAGLAIGFWKNQNEIKKLWKEDSHFSPLLLPNEIKKRKNEWHHAIHCVQVWSKNEE